MSGSGNVVYTARTRSTGGRENGIARSSDGRLDLKLSQPGSARIGTNPEQLLAVGWSACFEGAIGAAARQRNIALPAAITIEAEVDLNAGESGYFLSARLKVNVPGLERAVAQALVDAARRTCPYTKAMRGSVDIKIQVV